MQVIYLNNKVRIGMLYVSIFFTLFASNMVAAILLGEVVKYGFWAWGLFLLFFINGKFAKKNLNILCGILIFRCIIMLLQIGEQIELSSSTINSILAIGFYLNTIIQIAQLCTAEEYANIYLNLMFGISIVSLICFFILMSPLRDQILSIAQIDQKFIHNYIHLWGLDNNLWKIELFTRNSGPWWEPGAFQCFITYAMFMIMSGRCKNNKWLRIKFIVLIITWVTIQSTTGYLIMVFVLLFMFPTAMEIIFQCPYETISQKQKTVLFTVVLILIVIFFVTIGYANISEKLSEGNGSSTIRFNDVFSSFEISMERPFIGVGEDLAPYYETYEIVNNSAALLIIAISYGWPYLLFFVMVLFSGIIHFFKSGLFPAIGAGILLLVLCMTEGIVELPIMFVFFAEYKNGRLA